LTGRVIMTTTHDQCATIEYVDNKVATSELRLHELKVAVDRQRETLDSFIEESKVVSRDVSSSIARLDRLQNTVNRIERVQGEHGRKLDEHDRRFDDVDRKLDLIFERLDGNDGKLDLILERLPAA